MIDTLILDLDGPLLDGKLRHYQCYRDILTEHGFSPMPVTDYWDMKRSRVDRRAQLAVSGADAIYDAFLRAWLERIESRPALSLDRLHDGVVATLQRWKAAGAYLVLATMRHHEANLHWQLDATGLGPWFDEIFTVSSLDPAADKSLKIEPVLRRRRPDRALWIGDTEIDVAAARRLGVKVCAVSCGLRTADYLATLKPEFLRSELRSIELAELDAP